MVNRELTKPIEHRVNGKVTISINCDDISSIEFCDESEADHAIK